MSSLKADIGGKEFHQRNYFNIEFILVTRSLSSVRIIYHYLQLHDEHMSKKV